MSVCTECCEDQMIGLAYGFLISWTKDLGSTPTPTPTHEGRSCDVLREGMSTEASGAKEQRLLSH